MVDGPLSELPGDAEEFLPDLHGDVVFIPDFNPRETILPIVARHASGKGFKFLGTGSMVGNDGLFLTAEHVTGGVTTELLVAPMFDYPTTYRLDLVERDKRHDLALYRVDTYRVARPLYPDFETPVHPNWDVMTFEYGTTRTEQGLIRFSPATRKGNVTRVLDVTHRYGPAGGQALELSWASLRGASGAPVVYDDGGYNLIGVVIANIQYHLLPAEIDSVLYEDNSAIEEHHYMLPQALAVNIRHLRDIYERASATE